MKKRHGVLALLGSVSVITFLDRLAIAVAGPAVQHDLLLTPVQWGWALSSDVIANTVYEIPSGALGDRYGQRGELTTHCGMVVHLYRAYRVYRTWRLSFLFIGPFLRVQSERSSPARFVRP